LGERQYCVSVDVYVYVIDHRLNTFDKKLSFISNASCECTERTTRHKIEKLKMLECLASCWW